jgi:hypothetical protein
MKYALRVQLVGRALDDVRSAASTLAQRYGTEWCAETTHSGTVFWFNNQNTRTMFEGYCKSNDIPCNRDVE